jgi:hypothetical protein
MEGGPTISHLGISRPKKRKLAAPAASTVLPMEFRRASVPGARLRSVDRTAPVVSPTSSASPP